MRNFLNFILSIKFGGILMLVIAFVTGFATFVENDFGAIGAKAAVYNTGWFEFIIFLTFLNIAWNTYQIKPIKTKRFTIFAFHLSFLFIIIGAAATRYIGFEGMMSIREGESSNFILSDENYISLECYDQENVFEGHDKVVFTPIASKKGKISIKTPETNYTLRTTGFLQNAQEFITSGEDGPKLIDLGANIGGKFARFTISEGGTEQIDSYTVHFLNDLDGPNAFKITETSEGLFIRLPENGKRTNMMSSESVAVFKDTLYRFEEKQVYQVGKQSLMFRNYYEHAQMSVRQGPGEQSNGLNAVTFTLKNSDGKETESYALSRQGYVFGAHEFQFDGKLFKVSYGPKKTELPFSIKLIDFQLERYPASNSPSSYASEVILLDKREDKTFNFRIFMNNVLDYDGYRFFQSSYDRDEKGTVLSVNHDLLGMWITYFGYGLMIIAMFLAVFEKSTRFRTLIRAKNTSVIALAFIMVSGFTLMPTQTATAQVNIQKLQKIPASHLEKFNNLIVQGHSSRFKPLNTVSGETFRKYSRKSTYEGLSADQVFVGLLLNSDFWMRQDLIKVSNDDLKDIIGNSNSRVSFNDFFLPGRQSSYKLSKYIDDAYRKSPALRTKLDKDIITVDERVNVFYMAATGQFLNIFPVPNKPDEPWKNAMDDLSGFPSADSTFVKSVVGLYLSALNKGISTDQWDDANFYLNAIHTYQQKYAAESIKETSHFSLEIFYNKHDIFKQLSFLDGLIGFILLILLFIHILWPKYKFKWAIKVLVYILFIGFIIHTGGLALRWYISGHAPWSNGYESMIFIGWASMLAGFSFYKKAPIALAATAVLTFLILYVAHLSWMNPEITNLVPVLKSYWLTIHVAVITASYGFFALGSFLGILNLFLMILQNKQNTARIQSKIIELTRINEASLIAGIYLLTIGTFLGGVWANESWGRYWGWDPKETWAFITILIYAFVLHMRSIPSLKNAYAFNVGSLFSYFSVLMTYFGVNYYLSGLHSYAQGDPMPVPNMLYYTIAFFVGLSVFAYQINKKYEKK